MSIVSVQLDRFTAVVAEPNRESIRLNSDTDTDTNTAQPPSFVWQILQGQYKQNQLGPINMYQIRFGTYLINVVRVR